MLFRHGELSSNKAVWTVKRWKGVPFPSIPSVSAYADVTLLDFYVIFVNCDTVYYGTQILPIY